MPDLASARAHQTTISDRHKFVFQLLTNVSYSHLIGRFDGFRVAASKQPLVMSKWRLVCWLGLSFETRCTCVDR
jgi:hypothetical protein